MLSYKLDEEHEDLRKSVEEFARDVVAPVIPELYEKGEFPYDIVAQMGRMGLFGLPVPEEYGGMGGDYFALGLALEELARVDSSAAITLEAGVGLRGMAVYPLRAGRRHRRGRGDEDASAARRRAVGDRRVEVVHHQLRHLDHRRGRGRRGDRHPRERQAGDVDDPRAVRHAGIHRA